MLIPLFLPDSNESRDAICDLMRHGINKNTSLIRHDINQNASLSEVPDGTLRKNTLLEKGK